MFHYRKHAFHILHLQSALLSILKTTKSDAKLKLSCMFTCFLQPIVIKNSSVAFEGLIVALTSQADSSCQGTNHKHKGKK